MSKDFLYKSQASKTHFFDDMKRCEFTIKYIKNSGVLRNPLIFSVLKEGKTGRRLLQRERGLPWQPPGGRIHMCCAGSP